MSRIIALGRVVGFPPTARVAQGESSGFATLFGPADHGKVDRYRNSRVGKILSQLRGELVVEASA